MYQKISQLTKALQIKVHRKDQQTQPTSTGTCSGSVWSMLKINEQDRYAPISKQDIASCMSCFMHPKFHIYTYTSICPFKQSQYTNIAKLYAIYIARNTPSGAWHKGKLLINQVICDYTWIKWKNMLC